MRLYLFDEHGSCGEVFERLKRTNFEFELLACSSPEELMTACRRQPPSLVALDTLDVETSRQLLEGLAQQHPASLRMVICDSFQMPRVRGLAGWANLFCFKPLDEATLKRRIERGWQLRDLLCEPSLQRVIRGLQTLPLFSASYHALMRELEQTEPDPERIAQYIETDVGLYGTTLSLANSTFFGRSVEVTTAQEAVSVLGMAALQSLALATPALSLIDEEEAGGTLHRERFWAHSQAVARAARLLARFESLKAEKVNQAFSAGLLHDVGKLILASNYGESYRAYLAHCEETGTPLDSIEQAGLGTDHAEIGACLLAMWGLPTSIVQAIRFHHRPPLDFEEGALEILLYAANRFAHRQAHGEASLEPQQPRPALAALEERWFALLEESETTQA
jgi:putative nucleotidyltransferase with HDIG domain